MNKSCYSCSYYISNIDIANLSKKQQIDFTKITSDNLEIETEEERQYHLKLVNETVSNYCIGGLIKEGRIKERCSMHIEGLPESFSLSDLSNSFNNRLANRYDIKKTSIVLLIGLIPFFFNLYFSQQKISKLEELNKTLILKEKRLETDSILNVSSISSLNDSISRLYMEIKKQNYKNE